jgi:bacterioferritin-associated ferredoxin
VANNRFRDGRFHFGNIGLAMALAMVSNMNDNNSHYLSSSTIMIVCVCKAVSDRHIRASIHEGNQSFEELQFELGVATCCGRCSETVRDVMLAEGCSAEQATPMHFYERKAA